jgi:hypothetical protein
LFPEGETQRVARLRGGPFGPTAVAQTLTDVAGVSFSAARPSFWHVAMTQADAPIAAVDQKGDGYILEAHRSYGGTRISLYDAVDRRAVRRLASATISPKQVLFVRTSLDGEKCIVALGTLPLDVSAYESAEELVGFEEGFRAEVLEVADPVRLAMNMLGPDDGINLP